MSRKKKIFPFPSPGSRIPRAIFVRCEGAGRLLLSKRPAKFNKGLAEFVRGLKLKGLRPSLATVWNPFPDSLIRSVVDNI